MYSAMADEPTNPTATTRGSVSSVSTASLSPLTTLRMPGGRPASIISSASRIGTDGSRSDGLRMKALPQAIAGANFHIGIIAGKLNGVMPATTPGGRGVFALHEVGNTAGELDHLEAALDVALGIRDDLAVLGGEQRGEAVELLLHEVEELEHHAGAPLRIDRGPTRLCRLRDGDRPFHLGAVGERHLGLDLAGVG